MPKFSAAKARASTKQAIKGKLPKATAGGKRNTRNNPYGVRSDKRNASPINHSDRDPALDGPSVDPSAVKYDFNPETGDLNTRRMTRREELNDILQRSASPFKSPRPFLRNDRKALEE